MKVLNYLASLLPSFTKNRIAEDCAITRAELKESSIPSYVAAETALSGSSWRSQAMKDKDAAFKRTVKGGGKMITVIRKALENSLKNLDIVEQLVNQVYGSDLAASGLTFQKATLLQYIEAIAFVSKYSRRFLNYAYVMETESISQEKKEAGVPDSAVPAAQIKWLDEKFISFMIALNAVNHNSNELQKKIQAVPDVVVSEDSTLSMQATVGAGRLDPFGMGFIPTWMNPIYHVRMMVAEWQGARYQEAKEELKLLELRCLNYQRVLKGQPDAAIEQQLNYTQKRAENLAYRIKEMEEDAGIGAAHV